MFPFISCRAPGSPGYSTLASQDGRSHKGTRQTPASGMGAKAKDKIAGQKSRNRRNCGRPASQPASQPASSHTGWVISRTEAMHTTWSQTTLVQMCGICDLEDTHHTRLVQKRVAIVRIPNGLLPVYPSLTFIVHPESFLLLDSI